MSDDSLASEAFAIIVTARKAAPLNDAAYKKLKAQVEAVARRADEPDDIRDVCAEPLLRLEPGGKFEDIDD